MTQAERRIYLIKALLAESAIQTVREYQTECESDIQVIFNAFKDVDYALYKNRLAVN